MGLIRSTFSLVFLGLFLLIGLTVPVGERTLFGHVANIWESDEAQELVDGVKDSSGPLVDRVKRGVEAGLTDEVAKEVAGEKVAGEKVAGEKVAGEVAPNTDVKEPLATTEPMPSDGDSAQ